MLTLWRCVVHCHAHHVLIYNFVIVHASLMMSLVDVSWLALLSFCVFVLCCVFVIFNVDFICQCAMVVGVVVVCLIVLLLFVLFCFVLFVVCMFVFYG